MAQPIQVNVEYQQQPQNAAAAYEKARGYGSKWTFSLWDCFSPASSCLMSCCCPCVVFGRTQDRENGNPNSSGIGMMCCAFYCLLHIGGHSCLQTITRMKMREKYGIEGDTVSDFCASLCCPCCVLVQEDKESLLRTTGQDATTGQQYVAPAGMTYNA